jgi:hypothetical protein
LRIDSGSLRRCVEGVELHLVIVPAGMQAVEIGAAVDAEQHGLTVDHEGRIPVSQRGRRDQRRPITPVVPVVGEQPHTLAVALNCLAPLPMAAASSDNKRQKATRSLHRMPFARLSPRPSRDSAGAHSVRVEVAV